MTERARTRTVTVDGVPLRRGDRVRLRPSRRADILDLALAGRTAEVDGVEEDLEGTIHIAVTVDDDPGRDLGPRGQMAHRFFFSPEEVEPMRDERARDEPPGEEQPRDTWMRAERAPTGTVPTGTVSTGAVPGGAVADTTGQTHDPAGQPLSGDARAAGPARILVAGIGNIFMADDAFGPEVVEVLRRRRLPAGVHVADFGIRGLDLAYELLGGYDAVVLVDAMPRGERPGTLYVVEPEVEGDATPPEAHGMDPVKVLALARGLGDGRLPRTLIVGCEPMVRMSGDEPDVVVGLSEPVRAAVNEAAHLVASLVAELQECPAAGAGSRPDPRQFPDLALDLAPDPDPAYDPGPAPDPDHGPDSRRGPAGGHHPGQDPAPQPHPHPAPAPEGR